MTRGDTGGCNVVPVMPGNEKIARAAIELLRWVENGTAIVPIPVMGCVIPLRGLENLEDRP